MCVRVRACECVRADKQKCVCVGGCVGVCMYACVCRCRCAGLFMQVCRVVHACEWVHEEARFHACMNVNVRMSARNACVRRGCAYAHICVRASRLLETAPERMIFAYRQSVPYWKKEPLGTRSSGPQLSLGQDTSLQP